MADNFPMAGAINRYSHVDLLNKAIDVAFLRRNELAGLVSAKYFDVDKKDAGLTHVITSVGSTLPLPQVLSTDQSALPYFTPADGYDKTITLELKKSGIMVTRLMLEADRFDRVRSMATGQAKSAARADEYERIKILANAFTGDDGADSKDLCDDDHPQANKDQGTWDNKTTGALTGANLQAAVLLGDNMTDDQGDPDPVVPGDLLVPTTLRQKALELTGSAKRAEDALNADTVIINTLSVVVSPYLNLSSTVYYFLFGNRTGYDKGLHEVVLSDWNVADEGTASVDVPINKRIRSVKAFDKTVSKNIIGSTGS